MTPILRRFTAIHVLFVYLLTFLIAGCNSSNDTPANTQAQPPRAATQASAAQPVGIDDLVAPIALYPDQLLGQVLSLSTNPQEVLDIGNWLLQNQNLQGDALTKATKAAGFSPSAQYLAHFPQVVDNMCQEMDWTTQLGEAFKADQKAVMNAVQRKRQQAQQVGNLRSSPQMTVDTKTDNGQQYVEIKPANPKVVYVPQYNPVTIYNTQAPAAPTPAAAPGAAPANTTTTVVEQKSGVSTGTAVAIGLLSFGVGMAIGSTINNDRYYPYPSWGYGGMYYGGRPWYPPPYYPPVYPGYRPVYGYNPPPNYRWNQYNQQNNITINNNYYGRFNNNNGNRPSTLPANRPGGSNNGYLGSNNNNRPGGGNNGYLGGTNNNRPGGGNNGYPGGGNNNRPGGDNRPTTYQGARPSTGNQKPGASMANVNPANPQAGNRGGNGAASNRMAEANPNRPNTGGAAPGNRMAEANPNRPTANPGGNRPNAQPGIATREANPAAPATRPNTGNTNLNRGGDRGYANAAPGATRPSPGVSENRPAPNPGNGALNRPSPAPSAPSARPAPNPGGGAASRPSPQPAAPTARPAPSPGSANRGGGNGGGAFNSGGAKADRAASDRGRSSMGAPPANNRGGQRR